MKTTKVPNKKNVRTRFAQGERKTHLRMADMRKGLNEAGLFYMGLPDEEASGPRKKE